MTYTTAG